eukprot:141440_1
MLCSFHGVKGRVAELIVFRITHLNPHYCKQTLISVSLSVLFLSQLVLSCLILNQLYINEAVIWFWIHASIFLLPFVIMYFVCIVVIFIADTSDTQPVPTLPFSIIVMWMTAYKYGHVEIPTYNKCVQWNDQYLPIKIINFVLTSAFFVFLIISIPFCTVSCVLNTRENDWYRRSICCQLTLMLPSTVIHFIILCMDLNISLPLLILCAIACCVIIVYVTILIATMVACLKSRQLDLRDLMIIQYTCFIRDQMSERYSLACLIVSEMMQLLCNLCIATVIKSTGLRALLWINSFLLNAVFYKSYVVVWWLTQIRDNKWLRYVMDARSDGVGVRRDRMFSILLYQNAGDKDRLKWQIKYIEMNAEEKETWIAQHLDKTRRTSTAAMKHIAMIFYLLASMIAHASPIVCLVWMTVDKGNVWTISMAKRIFIGTMISWQTIHYALILETLPPHNTRKPINERHGIDVLCNRLPTIACVPKYYPKDIAMIIFLYLFSNIL